VPTDTTNDIYEPSAHLRQLLASGDEPATSRPTATRPTSICPRRPRIIDSL
jgi:hypothetical protein